MACGSLARSAAAVCGTALLGLAAGAGATPLLDGNTVRAQWLFPNISTAYQSVDVVVGPGLEIPGSAGGFDVNLSDTQIHFSNMTASGGYSSGTFNGWTFFDLLSAIDAFGSVTVNPATNMVGFNASRISFNADQIWVDFHALTGDANTVVVLDLSPAVVPEPSTALLLAGGTALLAALRSVDGSGRRTKISKTRAPAGPLRRGV